MPNESENTRSTISNIRKMLSQAEKGGVQNTIQNCVTVLQNDPVLADSIRLNLLSERIDIVKPMGWQRSGPTLTDTDMMYILRRMEKYGLYSEKRVSAAQSPSGPGSSPRSPDFQGTSAGRCCPAGCT